MSSVKSERTTASRMSSILGDKSFVFGLARPRVLIPVSRYLPREELRGSFRHKDRRTDHFVAIGDRMNRHELNRGWSIFQSLNGCALSRRNGEFQIEAAFAFGDCLITRRELSPRRSDAVPTACSNFCACAALTRAGGSPVMTSLGEV